MKVFNVVQRKNWTSRIALFDTLIGLGMYVRDDRAVWSYRVVH